MVQEISASTNDYGFCELDSETVTEVLELLGEQLTYDDRLNFNYQCLPEDGENETDKITIQFKLNEELRTLVMFRQ